MINKYFLFIYQTYNTNMNTEALLVIIILLLLIYILRQKTVKQIIYNPEIIHPASI